MKRTPVRAKKRYVLCYYTPIAKLLLGFYESPSLLSMT